MDTNQSQQSINSSGSIPKVGGVNKKLIRLGVVALVVLLIIVIISIWPKKFEVSSTNPSVKSVATVSPFFDIKFNRELNPSGISVSSTPNVVSSYKVNGKEIDISLKIPMSANQKYTINVAGVSDTAGVTLPNLQYSFTPKLFQSQNIPSDQKKALIQQQVPSAPSINNVNFNNTASLLQYGVSSSQVYDYEEAVFAFAPNSTNVSIVQSTVAPGYHDPNSASTNFTINFKIEIDTKTYNAILTYTNITQAQLTLYDESTNAAVYTSKTYDSAQAAANQ